MPTDNILPLYMLSNFKMNKRVFGKRRKRKMIPCHLIMTFADVQNKRQHSNRLHTVDLDGLPRLD